MRIYLDLETLPASSAVIHAEIARNISPPSNMKRPETIAAWVKNDKAAAVDEAIAKTALDGAFGHICVIGWAVNDEAPQSLDTRGDLSEADAIEGFMARVDTVLPSFENVTVIGHNVIHFDLRFLWQRAMVLGVHIPAWFPRPSAKPWDGSVVDTQLEWAGYRGTVSLDKVCKALGIPGKDDIDGSMVGELWAAGEHDRIASYCRADIERTRAVHRKMQIAYGEVAFAEAAE